MWVVISRDELWIWGGSEGLRALRGKFFAIPRSPLRQAPVAPVLQAKKSRPAKEASLLRTGKEDSCSEPEIQSLFLNPLSMYMTGKEIRISGPQICAKYYLRKRTIC